MRGFGGWSRTILREVFTSLPGQHRRTSQLPPEDGESGQAFLVVTGGSEEAKVIGFWHATLGLASWILWLGWGTYMWFFANAGLNDFIIAAAICLATFAFTIVGVPLVRLSARNRGQK